MAHIMTKRGGLDNIVAYEHMCDTRADLANISGDYVTLGSVAIVLHGESGLEAYMADSNGQWVALFQTAVTANTDSNDNENQPSP